MTGSLPQVTVLPGRHKRAKAGHPWVYANEVAMTAEAKALPSGSLVSVINSGGEPLGTAFFSPHTLVVARFVSRRMDQSFDEVFVAQRLQRALSLRDRLFTQPYYRLVHAEADGLPGLIVDRYGAGAVCQMNTAGMELHRDVVLAALQSVLQPEWLLLRNDSSQRSLENLASEVEPVVGPVPSPLEVLENGLVYLSDPAGGQKTGWFFDQRVNRTMVAKLASGARVLDAYSYLGGFGLLAGHSGASEVTLLDRSAGALDLAMSAASGNGLAHRVSTLRADVFDALEGLGAERRLFDIVVVDPPAFAKSKKDLPAALRGYRKLARLAAKLVAVDGFLFAASCSHTVDAVNFAAEISRGVHDAGRAGRILQATGAGPDHPTHPQLPESAYLKGLLYQLD